MGTNTAISYSNNKNQYRNNSSTGGFQQSKGDSPYIYGIVIEVDSSTRKIVCNIIKGNIGPTKTLEAIPFYKDNLTLPEPGDTVPLVKGPIPESGILGEQYSGTMYYLPPISVNQELAENTIVRTTSLSPTPPSLNPPKANYLAADTGFAFVDNGDNISLSVSNNINNGG